MSQMTSKRTAINVSQTAVLDVPVPKKLRLKPLPPESLSTLRDAVSSDQVLEKLVKIQQTLSANSDDANNYLRLLVEKFHASKDNVIRRQIASLLSDFVIIPVIDKPQLMKNIVGLIQSEDSHQVVSQLLDSLCICIQKCAVNSELRDLILARTKQSLNIESHLVRVKCIEVLGAVGCPVEGTEDILPVLARFSDDVDSRVRTAVFEALIKWHEKDIKLHQSLYEGSCQALYDEYESVRLTATKLVWILCQLYPESKVKVNAGGDSENRLVDDGFAKICDMLNDSSVRVRAEAARLLGSVNGVSAQFLEQTLDKKLMSNMRRKLAAHERQKQNFESGGWSSGKKWADDAPGEGVDEDGVTLMAMGACGAFVHGLEDEYMEVRTASIQSVCELATRNEYFASLCQDHLVDMFNDELEAVRLSAINALRRLGQHVILREDQCEILLGCLKDYSYEIREALRLLFCTIKLATQSCLNSFIFGLLDNLKRYPQDKSDIYKTMQLLGQHHPYFTLPLVPELLSLHPYFDSIEADIEDPAYVSILLIVLNAAEHCPTMAPLFPDHVLRHYRYVRDTLPDLVPQLDLEGHQRRPSTESCLVLSDSNSPESFMAQTLQRLNKIENMRTSDAAELISMCRHDLSRVADMNQSLAHKASFLCSYLQCQLALCQVLTNANSQLSQGNSVALLNKVISESHRMTELYNGLAVETVSDVTQLRLLAQSMQLLQLLMKNASTVKQTCVRFLHSLNKFDKFLRANELTASSVTKLLLGNMSELESCDPLVFYNVLKDVIKDYRPSMLEVKGELRRASAEILEPIVSTDKVIKFISGLIVSVDLTANLENVDSTQNIRIRVKYPDQSVHILTPRASEFKLIGDNRHRLVTKVLLSHTLWSEPCQVEITLVKSFLRDREFSEEKSNLKLDKKIESYIELCSPINLNVAPKSGKY